VFPCRLVTQQNNADIITANDLIDAVPLEKTDKLVFGVSNETTVAMLVNVGALRVTPTPCSRHNQTLGTNSQSKEKTAASLCAGAYAGVRMQGKSEPSTCVRDGDDVVKGPKLTTTFDHVHGANTCAAGMGAHGWLRDLTQEGVEPNPGPGEAFVGLAGRMIKCIPRQGARCVSC
jgi:hypothetical protein